MIQQDSQGQGRGGGKRRSWSREGGRGEGEGDREEGKTLKYGRAGGKEMRSKVWGSESAKTEELGAVSGEEKGCS